VNRAHAAQPYPHGLRAKIYCLGTIAKERQFRSSEEPHPATSVFFVSFLCAFPKLFPSPVYFDSGTNRLGFLAGRCGPVQRATEPYYALDCSVRGAALVKLVHRSIEQARPAGPSWPLLPAPSVRVEHEPVGAEERPSTGPAIARCLLRYAMVHERAIT
jgi:hypothetical protein